MSRLRELRLHGFKTFADPTRFVFERGVNAVIGPNGSGKSNMADAVRWVLGEQSNRSLRTRKSDDVIFAGSQQRKPQGMAEAVLTLDNADGWLPIEFVEVSIGRRAYRSGESEYLINGARARLRDIVELLGEGRLGANGLVVVGQGTVDAALSLRPEERRQLFEEAAGVKNLQVRKNEALARLSRARDNLTRVNDLVAELKPQVRRLALQAQHQQEHDNLLRRARAWLGESHHRRERAGRERLGEARRTAAAAEASLEALRAVQLAGRADVEAAERRYWEAEESARGAAGGREATREALIRAESRLESLTARWEELAVAVERGEQELAEVGERLQRRAAAVDNDVAPTLERAAHAEQAWQSAIAELAAADAALLAAEDRLAGARSDNGERLAADARRSDAIAAALVRRERLEPELAAAHEAHDTAAHGIEPERVALAMAVTARGAADARLSAAAAALQEAQASADEVQRRAAQFSRRTEAARGELETLRERAESGNRIGPLLLAAGWKSLLDAIDAPQDAWAAIEAVVGGELGEALLWRDAELNAQLDTARGSARFLASGSSEPDGRDEATLAVRATQTVAEWIGASDAPAVLTRTVVAPDLAALTAGWSRLPTGWFAVTPYGDLADGRGLLTLRGRGDAPGGGAARRHARRRDLSVAIAALTEDERAAVVAAAATQAAHQQARSALDDARRGQVDAERAERSARVALETAEGKLRRIEREVFELAGELERTRATENAAREVASRPPIEDDGGIDALTAAAADARHNRDAAALPRDAARAAWTELRASAEVAEARSAGQRQARSLLEARSAQLNATLPGQSEALAAVDADRALAANTADAARGADAQAAQARSVADADRERLRGELLELELERDSGAASGRLGELERAAQAAAIEASRREETLAALAREQELAFESLPEAAEEGMERPDQGLHTELAQLDDETLETELRRVRRTLGQIGSVNPFAVEEHRELAARLEEFTSQDADLGEAIGSTDELLARLDLEIGERFNAAFAAIGERFDEFCQLLFAGGSASLQMSDGSDGEAPGGIEIVVRPPGKRLQRLAMLSGGERALTGVALLFAMLSVNPVPFCILDEVDAALDEANIGRFVDALRKLSESTDFVVITHNRATIEVADTIYGVTMSDAAVSRVLSLRLADLPVEVSA